MIAIVLVSHSYEVAVGASKLARQMCQDRVTIIDAGGLSETEIGTNVERIHNALQQAMNPDGVLVLLDLGSAILSTQMAIEMLPEEDQPLVILSEAPLVEGAIIAAIEASVGNDLNKVNAAAEAASSLRKLQ